MHCKSWTAHEKELLLCVHLTFVKLCLMGSSASIWGKVVRPQSKYASRFHSSGSSGSFVVATSDFDPDDIHWPETWGVPLPLKKSMAIRIISDGGDRAFGHYVGQPERRGYFLKHLTEALGSESPSATPSIEPFSKAAKAHIQLPYVPQGVQSAQSQIQHRSSEPSPPQPTPQPLKSGRIPSGASTSIPCSPQSTEYSPTSPFVPDQTPVSLTSFPPPTSPHSSLSTTATRRLGSLDRDRFDKCDKPEASQASQTFQAHETSRLRGTLQTPSSHFSLPHVVPKLERFEPFIEHEESRHSSALGSNPKCRMRASEIPHQVDMHGRPGRPTDFRGVKAEDEGGEGHEGALGAMNGSHPRCQSTSSVRSRQLRQLETQPRNPLETLRTLQDPVDPVDPVAAELGLDQTEEHLLWLVDAAASVELPEGWITFPDDDGRAVYYHERKLFITRKHPMLQRFKVYAEQLQKFYQTLSSKALNSTKIRAHLAVILNEVLNRCHRELPPHDSSASWANCSAFGHWHHIRVCFVNKGTFSSLSSCEFASSCGTCGSQVSQVLWTWWVLQFFRRLWSHTG